MSTHISAFFDHSEAHRPSFALVLARRAAVLAAAGPMRLIRFWRVRRELSALSGMSGIELRDIGLTPFDVANAMESVGPESATDGLARIARDRRFGRES
jgi:uncharacterized protein YjiS (DUF1127 family)